MRPIMVTAGAVEGAADVAVLAAVVAGSGLHRRDVAMVSGARTGTS